MDLARRLIETAVMVQHSASRLLWQAKDLLGTPLSCPCSSEAKGSVR
jgi:hypothetical protein